MRGQTRGGTGDLPRGRTGRPAHPGHLPASLAHTLPVAFQPLADDIANRRLSSHRDRAKVVSRARSSRAAKTCSGSNPRLPPEPVQISMTTRCASSRGRAHRQRGASRVCPRRPPVSHFGTTPKKSHGAVTQQTIGSPNLLICCAIRPPKRCCRMVSNEPFCHRRNKDGTIDSICTRWAANVFLRPRCGAAEDHCLVDLAGDLATLLT